MTENERNIAVTIRNQLGGNRFIAMTGAKNFVALNETNDYQGGLTFMIPACAHRIRTVRIYLKWNDTYKVEFCRIHKLDHTVVKTADGVYCDTLQEVFTANTGLYTSL